jgi:hypothetical protein
MGFDDGAIYDAGRFASQNGYLGNDWGVRKNGEGYLESGLKGRSDLQRKVRDIVEKLTPRIDELDEDFSRRYGWTLNRGVNRGRRITRDIITGAVSDLRREILDDASERLAKEFKGDKSEARRALKGTADLSRHSNNRQARIGNARDRYLRRISDISRADKEVRSIHAGFNKEVGSYNKRFGPRLLGKGGG